MIAQHVYSRCMEGYFSKTAAIADSTTVTMRMDAFRRQEQAREIAQKCEDISTLEDTRPVPNAFQGVYRGVLKVRRINRQLTLICRSYRLHSDQNGQGGEFRDFTYSTNYLISGEDKEQFLNHPEACLVLQDFEPYPSIMKRIQESYRIGKNGRIEASEEYSLFHHERQAISFEVFQKAGFTRELFIDYISSILHRVSNSHYAGHESEKVLLLLPRKFNEPWETSGGNPYAEEVLAATLKLLPYFVSGQLNATTGGRTNPDASVLDGYHLVFMENAPTREWAKKGYFIIDLEHKQSYLPEKPDSTYAAFLWEHLQNVEEIESFQKEYCSIFGDGEIDHSPEKFALVMQLLKESSSYFVNGKVRAALLTELVGYSEDSEWHPKGIALAKSALRQEVMSPTNNQALEKELLDMLSGASAPEDLKSFGIEILVQNTYQGSASEAAVSYIFEQLEKGDLTVSDKISRANQSVLSNAEYRWYENTSLMDFYTEVLRSSEISGDQRIKKEILEILSNWHTIFLNKKDWANCSRIVSVLAEQLVDPRLSLASRREIYQSLFYLVYYGDEKGRQKAFELVQKDARRNASNVEYQTLLWQAFRDYGTEYSRALPDEIVRQMVSFAIGKPERFLREEWEPLYRHFVEISLSSHALEILKSFRGVFESWESRVTDRASIFSLRTAMYLAEWNNMDAAGKEFKTDLPELRKIVGHCKEEGNARKGAELLYKRYELEETQEGRRNFFASSLNPEERCQLEMIYQINSEEDIILEKSFLVFQEDAYRSGILQAIADFHLEDEKEIAVASERYFTLIHASAVSGGTARGLHTLCQLCRKELEQMETISLGGRFRTNIQEKFGSLMRKQDLRKAAELTAEDILFLKKAGMLPLGDSWDGLNVLSDFLSLPDTAITEDFIPIRQAMIQTQNGGWKELYISFLEKKCDHLRRDKHYLEYLLNAALLAEQIYQEKTGESSFDLKHMTELTYGVLKEESLLAASLSLLAVLRRYADQQYYDKGVYALEPVRNRLLNLILQASRQNPRLFADDLMLKKYIQLGREDKAALERMGFRRALHELPKEWQEKYGIKEERSLSEVVVPIIVGGVLLILGIVLLILYAIFYDSIGARIGNILGIALVTVGFLGTMITVIYMLVSGRKEQDFV